MRSRSLSTSVVAEVVDVSVAAASASSPVHGWAVDGAAPPRLDIVSVLGAGAGVGKYWQSVPATFELIMATSTLADVVALTSTNDKYNHRNQHRHNGSVVMRLVIRLRLRCRVVHDSIAAAGRVSGS